MAFDPVTLGAAVQLAKDPATIKASVEDWLDDHPEATTTVEDGSITKAKLHDDLADEIEQNTTDVGVLKSAIADMNTATSAAIGKALSPKTVADGKVTEWQFKTIPSGGGGGGGAVDDVQINGTSIVDGEGVANVPIAGIGSFGVVKTKANGQGGISIDSSNDIIVSAANASNIKVGTSSTRPVTPAQQHASTFYGLAKAAGDTTQSESSNAVGTYTDAAKSAISTMLNGSVSVSGTTPSITALPGIQYICGEVSTLDITLPASGCVDVVFESGSTATVLTVTPPTGVTLKWANGFDPTALEANTTYEINIKDGLGVAGTWT